MNTPTTKHEPDQEVEELAFLDFRDSRAQQIVEKMGRRLANEFGVTVQGPHLTLRWSDGPHHVEASFVCVSLQHTGTLTAHDSDYNK